MATNRTKTKAVFALLALFGAFASAALLEIALRVFPSLIPDSVLVYPSNEMINRARGIEVKHMVEYLDKSPYVRFRPNSLIRSFHYRGDNDFASTWITDKIGFKNPIGLYDNAVDFDAVALGDSFTEGMGVPVNMTWPFLLSEKGILTLNLGVQGYAPQQLNGAYNTWGRQKSPKIVLWGFTSGFYKRATAFAKHEFLSGGIGLVARFEHMGKLERWSSSLLTLALIRASVQRVKQLSKCKWRTRVSEGDACDANLSRYAPSIESTARLKFSRTEAWRLTEQVILDARKVIGENGGNLVVVHFPRREHVYWKKLNECYPSLPFPQYREEILLELQRFLVANDVNFLDLSNALIKHVQSFTSGESQLPYFKKDGHLNATGHRIVAEEIYQYLHRRGN